MRSALAGAADIDGDGRVTYAEAHAFISAANGRVQDARARLSAYAAPPALHRDEPLFDRSRLFAEQLDQNDPWQFKNVIV